jgi:hypothetical protein
MGMISRRLLLLLLPVMVLAISGCRNSTGKMIQKTWKVSEVLPKVTYDPELLKLVKEDLMRSKMNFSENKYTMMMDGNIIESGSYTIDADSLVIKTDKGSPMKAKVANNRLTLETTDFTITLLPEK